MKRKICTYHKQSRGKSGQAAFSAQSAFVKKLLLVGVVSQGKLPLYRTHCEDDLHGKIRFAAK